MSIITAKSYEKYVWKKIAKNNWVKRTERWLQNYSERVITVITVKEQELFSLYEKEFLILNEVETSLILNVYWFKVIEVQNVFVSIAVSRKLMIMVTL